jgi:hypothetical protein
MLQMILIMAIGGVLALGIAVIALEWRVLLGHLRSRLATLSRPRAKTPPA